MKQEFEAAKEELRNKLLATRSIIRYVENIKVEEHDDETLKTFIEKMGKLDRGFFNMFSNKEEGTFYVLKRKANAIGITDYNKMTKAELIIAIEKGKKQ